MSPSQSKLSRLRRVGSVRAWVTLLIMVGSVLILLNPNITANSAVSASSLPPIGTGVATLACPGIGETDLSTGTNGQQQGDAVGTTEAAGRWSVVGPPGSNINGQAKSIHPSYHPAASGNGFIGYATTPWVSPGTTGGGPYGRINWISYTSPQPFASGSPKGTYTYSIKFSVPNGGRLYVYAFTADNKVTLTVKQPNGVPLPSASWSSPGTPTSAPTDFENWYPITGSPIIQDIPHSSGQYTLEADVYNSQDVTGLAVYTVLCPPVCTAGTIDLNTGTTVAFKADPPGAPDPDWIVTTGVPPQHPLSVAPVAGWVAPGATANWVSPNQATGIGPYTYSITFTVPDGCLSSVLQISGYAADNGVTLYLNNIPIPGASDTSVYAFNTLHLTSPISQHLAAGTTYTLSAIVTNQAGTLTGLLVIAMVTIL